MSTNQPKKGQPWAGFDGPNLGYAIELYDQYVEDPKSIDPEVKELFDNWGAPPASTDELTDKSSVTSQLISDATTMKKVVAAAKLAENIRTYGHLAADINPLEKSKTDAPFLDPENYQLSNTTLKAIPAKVVWENAPENINNGLEAIEKLKQIYTKSLAFEFSHVHDDEERKWLDEMVESEAIYPSLSPEDRIELLHRLTEVEGFEKFLHRTFVGQKRFSIEGLDTMVPMLDEIIHAGVHDGAQNVMIGMAHRGRLNVLAHVLGKPYEKIFSEFHHAPNKELVPSEGSMGINYGWTGDVKYHLGADREIEEENHEPACITLANNPSHLEFVDPVVEGYARAAQEDRSSAGYPKQDVSKSFSILIHGDAAFPGEGIVAETLNLSQLPGYKTGGTVHIIANNLLGFTTKSSDSRSTKYASDLAKGFEIPIVHVNADDPEACLAAIILAYQYRKKFQKDFLIDLIGYRRFGHNEMDDPSATNPQLYDKVNNHPTVRHLYAEALQAHGVLTKDQAKEMEKDIQDNLDDKYGRVSKDPDDSVNEIEAPEQIVNGLPAIETSVPLNDLEEINTNLLKWPEGFTVYPKLEKILKRREKSLNEGGKIDWALAETLAFSTILKDGTPIRLTGQDTERGTFAHRHLILHDPKTGETFSPLHMLPQANASYAIHNSPLSEASVVGFEYGYNVFAPETLVLWEAQYGDFANAAQVIYDQFVSAGRAKWGQKSGLVLLLPHGYEGQGPEHSSGRLERFLQLSAENNWTVANLSTSAQYFHVLRRQAALTTKEEVRPLIIMTPKSLLRNQRVASTPSEFSEGQFKAVYNPSNVGTKKEEVKRLVLCSGKVAIDLDTAVEANEQDWDWVDILRIEQLYPYPEKEMVELLDQYKNLEEVVWVQEEPKNMGAWSYIEPKIRASVSDDMKVTYVGRPERSSPAAGEPNVYKREQERIVNEALKLKKTDTVTTEGGNVS
ncbi:2-oxoglutarate dehydrogenase E1 component [Pseudalkalibacillus salsuginis]|uniref:2-oxoglutarate dehydrogenase E1 component n=1 Tax=Pseudalkalibacillus salsuginis TaxID=2910972 RepID=UPI001F3CE53D|nr:2-oxoglutarate dehydrogenase E1 component [Pseudalkalibacillus salsuginis]MCF6411660.1 2-oxoglutarate dehydrogenase E1 component [Pseudalkalibacillus salsuginis]